ncbi:YdiU family protein [Mesorhizobium sp. B292B1B]|uniref:protein adenylyltransferase SelO n=1 Tax=unclassified Mesorhizobium TaxID=325217 RepID=UPI001126FD13|nr:MULTISPECIES: YdiU family protein [unclassified Mesorhizobium]MCA0014825.1 YdiU family protein [Mesorhizobium sp. B294B1A1]MCA0041054.1 YdiU family protein [Mesorhizobium sp. B292B1B]TPM42698.1 YdiU family protein [Mesorhizobium sp. B2-3-2]
MQLPALRNSYAQLPERFFAPTDPKPVSEPRLIRFNQPLAEELRLDADQLTSREGVEMLAGNRFPEGLQAIALAYAGHQFGNFVPQLGDGRALLLGEVVDVNGTRRDIQLKGSGPTRFSRNGDGRAALGPVLREYVVSEAMAALGIPTTRSLAAVLTGDPVYREVRLPGAVLTRVAASHIRIGTFQYFAARHDVDGLKILADYAIDRHFPQLAGQARPYRALLEAVVTAQAGLVARWMLVGFIHGVMNTDNTAISGETIDYGPCAFMDAYDPSAVFSSIDRAGRYAYANQPRVATWNLTRFAETLLPLMSMDENDAVAEAEDVLRSFQSSYEAVLQRGFRRKLGLLTEAEGDLQLAADFLDVLARGEADFTLGFRRLGDDLDAAEGQGTARPLFQDPDAFDAWSARWRERVASEAADTATRRAAMHAVNPKFIPRNHRIEEMIQVVLGGDFTPFEEILGVVSRPFDEQPEMEHYADPPRSDERVLQTFCGT